MNNLVDKLYGISLESVEGCDTNNSMDILELLKRLKITSKKVKDTEFYIESNVVTKRSRIYKTIYNDLEIAIDKLKESLTEQVDLVAFNEMIEGKEEDEDGYTDILSIVDIDEEIETVIKYLDLMDKFIDIELME